MFNSCQTYVNARKHREYICLDEGNQHFQHVQEDSKKYAYHTHSAQQHSAVFRHNEDYAHHAEDLDVTCQHVCEKSDGERNRLYHGAEDLDNRHERLEQAGDVGIHYLLIIMLRTGEVHREEGEERQHQGAGDIAGEIGPSREEWDDTHEVVQQDEQEGRKQVRPWVLSLHCTAAPSAIRDLRSATSRRMNLDSSLCPSTRQVAQLHRL